MTTQEKVIRGRSKDLDMHIEHYNIEHYNNKLTTPGHKTLGKDFYADI